MPQAIVSRPPFLLPRSVTSTSPCRAPRAWPPRATGGTSCASATPASRWLFDYLDCGVLANGFSRVRYEACGHELLVAFSCKRRGVCPFPKRIRWHLARAVRLTSTVLKLFVRALFGYQRRRGRELGLAGQGAACSFVQHFGNALQHNTHFHVLVPEGLFAAPSPGTEQQATFLPLPPPDDEEVESLLRTVARRVVRLLKRLGRLDEDAFPEDALQSLQAALHPAAPAFAPRRRAPTSTQAPLRLPRRFFVTRQHTYAVLAPNAKLRPRVVPRPPPAARPPCVTPPPADPLPPSTRRQRLPWAELLRRSFSVDVLTCSKCGGLRRVLAYITDPLVVRAILDPLHLPSRPLPVAPARAHPQASFPADLCA